MTLPAQVDAEYPPKTLRRVDRRSGREIDRVLQETLQAIRSRSPSANPGVMPPRRSNPPPRCSESSERHDRRAPLDLSAMRSATRTVAEPSFGPPAAPAIASSSELAFHPTAAPGHLVAIDDVLPFSSGATTLPDPACRESLESFPLSPHAWGEAPRLDVPADLARPADPRDSAIESQLDELRAELARREAARFVAMRV